MLSIAATTRFANFSLDRLSPRARSSFATAYARALAAAVARRVGSAAAPRVRVSALAPGSIIVLSEVTVTIPDGARYPYQRTRPRVRRHLAPHSACAQARRGTLSSRRLRR
jgi:hypothetical protein